MERGEIFEKNGKKYIVSDVWDNGNYGFREYTEEVLPVFEAPIEEVKEEAPKKRVVRRKKA